MFLFKCFPQLIKSFIDFCSKYFRIVGVKIQEVQVVMQCCQGLLSLNRFQVYTPRKYEMNGLYFMMSRFKASGFTFLKHYLSVKVHK